MPEARPATPALERFARETLGCRCSAEVFERVEDDRSPLPGLPEIGRRIAIGGRLLIYLAQAPDGVRAAERVPVWVHAGLAERDRRGMNRLRLVVLLKDPIPTATAMESAFAGLPGLDDRVHLHILPATAAAGI
ncbi:MAG: hypothetical protein ACM3ST_12590 [Bdellovibrio bacteriovorus]